jgi:hypothetical protein
MGFQVIVDLAPPGVRDPVLISLGFVLASACVRLRSPPAERRRDMGRRESDVTCGAEGASCIYAKKALSSGPTQLKACAAAVTTSSKTLQARRG